MSSNRYFATILDRTGGEFDIVTHANFIEVAVSVRLVPRALNPVLRTGGIYLPVEAKLQKVGWVRE